MKDLIRRVAGRAVAQALARRSQPLPADLGPVLVVAPHADDETLGCAGLLASQADRGVESHVVFVTDSAGSPEEPIIPGLAERRRAEALAALAVLGVPPTRARFLDAPDGRLNRLESSEALGLRTSIAGTVRDRGVREVFTPFQGGGSSEHDATTELVRAALTGVAGLRIWEYPVWAWWDPRRLSGQLGRPRENFALSLAALRERKRRALACHASQLHPRPPASHAVLPPVLAELCTGPREFYFLRQP
jgi:LmbE family N-acetylglucosaminyl deacetylase